MLRMTTLIYGKLQNNSNVLFISDTTKPPDKLVVFLTTVCVLMRLIQASFSPWWLHVSKRVHPLVYQGGP